ncbi:UNVERIFIED_CONTAM: hypothetical protein K2H54_029068 [Gekko kuhli]
MSPPSAARSRARQGHCACVRGNASCRGVCDGSLGLPQEIKTMLFAKAFANGFVLMKDGFPDSSVWSSPG